MSVRRRARQARLRCGHNTTPPLLGRSGECKRLGDSGMGREEAAEEEQAARAAAEERYLALPAEAQVRL